MLKKVLSSVIVLSIVLCLAGCGCSEEKSVKLNTDVTIKENNNILNNKKVKINVEEQSFADGILKVIIDNKTNKQLSVAVLKSLVNHISLNKTTANNEIVKKKEKKTVFVHFNKAELKENKIGEVSSIKVLLTLIDTNSFKEIANTGYFELETSSDYKQDLSIDSGTELVNKSNIHIFFIDKKIIKDNLVFNIKVFNDKKKAVFLNIGETKVNNAEFPTSLIYDTIPAKSLTNCKLIIPKSALKEYYVKASDIKYATVDISVFDVNTYKKLISETSVKLQ